MGGRTSGDVIGGWDSLRKTHPGFISHQRVYFGALQPMCFTDGALAVFLRRKRPLPASANANANG